MTNMFKKLIHKIIKTDNNFFSPNYDPTDNIGIIQKFFFNILACDKFSVNEFIFLHDTMDSFAFINSPDKRNNFINLFCKVKRIHNILTRFVYNYKYKKAKISVNTDLQLNDIYINGENVICIYHVGSKYLFKIEELLKIIYMALTNSFSLFPQPISVKNPYNNIPFGKSVLYYIYFYLSFKAKLKFIKTEYLNLFLKFKDCNFDITDFVNKHEHLLRECAIINYINNTQKSILVDQIKMMINMYNSNIDCECGKIKISPEFPEDDLIQIMKPYLKLKLVGNYSMVKHVQNRAKKMFIKKLEEFHKFNPSFGRKFIKFKTIYKDGKIKRIKSHVEFSTAHKKLNETNTQSFMESHIEYKYDPYGSEGDDDDVSTIEDDMGELVVTNVLENTHEHMIDDDSDYENDYNEEDDESEGSIS